MNSEVLLLGVIVGGVNYLFSLSLPLRLRAGHARPARRGPVSVLLDTIGIASIRAAGGLQRAGDLADAHRLAPTLTGFLVLGGRLLENPQHHCPDPAVGVCLWSGTWKITNGL